MLGTRAATYGFIPRRGDARASLGAVADRGGDAGLPVDEPPPLIEPAGLPEKTEAAASIGWRPPRRSFLVSRRRSPLRHFLTPPALRPATRPAPATGLPPSGPPPPADTGSARPVPAAELPELIEPVAQPRAGEPPNAERTKRQSPPPSRRQAARKAAASRLKAAGGLLPAGRWTRLGIAAGAAIALIAVIVYLPGIRSGPGAHRYAASPPPSDPATRLAYYQAGAKAGEAEAQLQLAILYAKGIGVPQDYATAAEWFRAAADQGVARAQYDLGVLFERGRGVPVDLTEAANWYRKAAAAKYPLAEYNLAVGYTKGQGVRQDLTEAASWYRRAAGHGVVQAMINLAAMYEKGEGVAASPVDAYAWYLAAGNRGSDAAARRAQDLYAGFSRLDQLRAEALASDVAVSIHDSDPDRGDAMAGSPDAKPAAPAR